MFGNKDIKKLEERINVLETVNDQLVKDSKADEATVARLENEKKEKEQEHDLAIKELEHTQKLELSTKEFDMKHFKDNELKTALDEKVVLEQKIAVLTKENEMLIKITDLNADVIDVKELVGSLIKKLPEININSISVVPNGK